MTGFMEIFKNVKESKPYPDVILGLKKKPKKITRTKLNKAYPASLTIYIGYGKKPDCAHKARNEIEESWNKFGSWVGHGSDVLDLKNGECDVQVNFKESDIPKAKEIANKIMKKYHVTGKFHKFNLSED